MDILFNLFHAAERPRHCALGPVPEIDRVRRLSTFELLEFGACGKLIVQAGTPEALIGVFTHFVPVFTGFFRILYR